MSEEIHKRFDRLADGYARYRPVCPPELVQQIAMACSRHTQAWEPGCGSGQITHLLAEHFQHVLATDPAASAIERAPQCDGVQFAVGDASHCDLPNHSVNLIVSAQAAHWFDMQTFATEVRRVAADGAVVAVWCYDRPRVSDAIDEVVDHFYFEVLRGCWDDGRRHIDTRYSDLVFPFDERQVESPNYTATWSIDDMLGYLGTWSAGDTFYEQTGRRAVAEIEAQLRSVWGMGVQEVRWPTAMRLGVVS